MARNRDQRRRQILSELEQQPSLRVSELAVRLGVSTETVRRDLDALTEDGQIDRTYGGAVRRRSLEPSVSERHSIRAAERERIARRAGPLLDGAGLIMIGSGATTVQIARRIALEMNGVTVIAHSFGVATVLALNPTITVLMTPGVYHAGEGAMHGAETVAFLDGFRADWAILGASGLDAAGPSDALLAAGQVYRRMVARADRTMLVADGSKFGKQFPACWAAWDDISCLVSDTDPPDGLIAADAATEIIVA